MNSLRARTIAVLFAIARCGHRTSTTIIPPEQSEDCSAQIATQVLDYLVIHQNAS